MISTNRLGFFCVLAALAVGFLGFAQNATADVIYQEIFGNNGANNLNGFAPDLPVAGANTWVAYNGFKESGVLPTASVNLGAYLPFTPVAGNLYTLSASFTGVTTDGTNAAWFALGFGKGVPTAPQSGENRFVSGPTVGRAWMLYRGNNTSAAAATNNTQIGTTTSGTGTTGAWTSNSAVNGGDMDMKITLDTSVTPYKATFFAERPGDPETQVSIGALNIINPADIGAVGFARTTNSAAPNAGTLQGNITAFKLEVSLPANMLGDVNGDHLVDDTDFGIIRDHLFMSGGRSIGDLTNDGIVDFSDFRQWKTAHGGGSGASVDFGGAVPEPASGVLAIIAASVGIFAGRRRSAQRKM
jgi:hypothetical protein